LSETKPADTPEKPADAPITGGEASFSFSDEPPKKSVLKELLASVFSSDDRTRKVAWIFYLSFVCLIGVVSLLVLQFMQNRVTRKAQQERATQIEKMASERIEAERKKNEPPPHFSLGTFTLPLTETADRYPGTRNVAEFELSITCDTKETCDWIENHLDLSRGFLSPLMTPRNRMMLSTPQGKRAFRDEITARLNVLIGSKGLRGRVLEVFFPRFVLS